MKLECFLERITTLTYDVDQTSNRHRGKGSDGGYIQPAVLQGDEEEEEEEASCNHWRLAGLPADREHAGRAEQLNYLVVGRNLSSEAECWEHFVTARRKKEKSVRVTGEPRG